MNSERDLLAGKATRTLTHHPNIRVGGWGRRGCVCSAFLQGFKSYFSPCELGFLTDVVTFPSGGAGGCRRLSCCAPQKAFKVFSPSVSGWKCTHQQLL